MKRLLCSGSFGLALLCFCLPWVTVSCQQQKLISATGIQLVSGMDVKEPGSGMFGTPAKSHRVEPNVIAIVALVAAVAALVTSLAGGRASALPGLIGIVTAFALKVKLDQDILGKGEGFFHIDYESGYIAYLVLVAVGTVVSFIPERAYGTAARTEPAMLNSHGALYPEDAAAQPGARAPATATSPVQTMKKGETVETAELAVPRFCSQCGTAVIEGAVFCCECGVRVCPES